MTSTVYIAKNVYGGDGLGRLGDGRVVFVPGAWAGEQVKAEIVEEKKHFVKARLVEVVEKSPDRVECAADHVERCLRVVAVSGHVTEHHEALAALPPRVRKRRLERLRIRVDVAHDGELHAALTSRRTASAG